MRFNIDTTREQFKADGTVAYRHTPVGTYTKPTKEAPYYTFTSWDGRVEKGKKRWYIERAIPAAWARLQVKEGRV